MDQASGKLHLAHFYSRMVDGQKHYFETDAPVSDIDIREALEDADRILGEAISLRSSVAEFKKANLKPPPPSPRPPGSSARP